MFFRSQRCRVRRKFSLEEEFKERMTGSLKLLQLKNGKIWILGRQETTLKIRIEHPG